MKYPFKYRLTQKSSLATIAKAVRALGYDMSIEKGGFRFGWFKDTPGSLTGQLYNQHFALDENVPEWLNSQLENAGLLAPKDLEP
ncbi:MAG: hypothetical protein IKM85_04360 [Bacteroidales bacterium]|nr:hypothetical protein [Bacteroidales bacterium]